MPNDANLRIIAAIIYAFGTPKNGAFEVRIPNSLLAKLPPRSTVEQDVNPTELVLRVRRPVPTIQGEWIEVPETSPEPTAPLLEPPCPVCDGTGIICWEAGDKVTVDPCSACNPPTEPDFSTPSLEVNMFKAKFLNKQAYGHSGEGEMYEGSESIAEQENQQNIEDNAMPEENHETENAAANVINDGDALAEFSELEKTKVQWPARG